MAVNSNIQYLRLQKKEIEQVNLHQSLALQEAPALQATAFVSCQVFRQIGRKKGGKKLTKCDESTHSAFIHLFKEIWLKRTLR